MLARLRRLTLVTSGIALGLSLGLSLPGCSAGPVEVVVEVRTDLLPGIEFQSVQVQLGERTQSLAVSSADDFQRGVRAAEIGDVATGPASLSVTLADALGAVVLRRDLDFVIENSVGLTVVLTRNCLDIACAEGEDAIGTTCVDGRCLPRACSQLDRAACGTPECEVTSDCAVGVACAVPDCVDGACLAFGDASRCEGGEYCQPDVGCLDAPASAADEDGDGVLDDVDCDPTDAAIGFGAERPCESDCATGIEVCVSGEWRPCDAPSDCSCGDDDTRTISCGMCGLITQTCSGGNWESGACEGRGACTPGSFEDVGSCDRCGTQRRTCLDDCTWDAPSCTAQGTCEAGEIEDDIESCGSCGEQRSRSRTCSSSCEWGSWSAFGSCATGMGCMPMGTQEQARDCGACGTETRTRTCGPECVFDPWSPWGACEGEGACTPSTPQSETRPCGSCGGGTELRTRTCTSACTWGSWSPWGSCTTPAVLSTDLAHSHTCSVLSDGSLWCNGSDHTGQLGEDMLGWIELTPVRIGPPTGWTDVSTAGDWNNDTSTAIGHTCGIRGGALYCWGQATGRLGLGAISADVPAPMQVGSDTDWTDVSAGVGHTCGIRGGGQLYCWGEGGAGETGLGSNMDTSSPTRVGTAGDWISVSSGTNYTCGLRAGGSLWCWGGGWSGRLGLGSPSSFDTPQQVAGTWEAVATGYGHTCAIQSGQLYCWGLNDRGQLGLGDMSNRDAPTRVGTDSDWTSVAAGQYHGCGLRSGRAYCWGDGDEGTLGDGRSVDTNTPVQVGTATNWSQIGAGTEYSCGLRDGARYCWGRNGLGRLGNGTSMGVSTPVQICI